MENFNDQDIPLEPVNPLDMMKFESIKDEIISNLKEMKYSGDLSDIGNEIGIVIGKYINNKDMGYNLDNFNHGVKHGISLANGTHG